MDNEIWKDIPGFEGVYAASNKGRVRSLPRIDCAGRNRSGKILAQQIVKGYLVVGLNHNKANKQCKVHRLVALAFIPNPSNLPQINHKDENPLNNNVGNLEWCDYLYNRNYGGRNERAAKTQSVRLRGRIPHPEYCKSVYKIDPTTGDILDIFPSASEAARQNGLQESKISSVCNGYRKTTGGYKWRYK